MNLKKQHGWTHQTHSVCNFSLRNWERERKKHLSPRSESTRTGGVWRSETSQKRMSPCCRCAEFQESRLAPHTDLLTEPLLNNYSAAVPQTNDSDRPWKVTEPNPRSLASAQAPQSFKRWAEVRFLSFVDLTNAQTHRDELHTSSHTAKDLRLIRSDGRFLQENIFHRSLDFKEFALVKIQLCLNVP